MHDGADAQRITLLRPGERVWWCVREVRDRVKECRERADSGGGERAGEEDSEVRVENALVAGGGGLCRDGCGVKYNVLREVQEVAVGVVRGWGGAGIINR
jgi:hypothetical protein